ncbi:hypothetical protein G0Q06_02200 [Puniceicoccales bacterium CK1056]|uniref:Uncharacterized protein n=1 Tax=Oceanipulchritudo coccoides TaxID=2706888 RepID=A0A6B2LXG7_9BACT|nr:hypothetical protein [Oceanipulchritudo coccoides]NDV61258.1 hypothetical protein [Oceanipulchritudo coccoides]
MQFQTDSETGLTETFSFSGGEIITVDGITEGQTATLEKLNGSEWETLKELVAGCNLVTVSTQPETFRGKVVPAGLITFSTPVAVREVYEAPGPRIQTKPKAALKQPYETR